MSSIARRPSGRWRARFRDQHGTEHARHFPTRQQAQAWVDASTAAELSGIWARPSAGRVTLGAYYAQFASRQLWAPTTRRAMDHALTRCPLSGRPLGTLTRADVEAWVKAMADGPLAGATVRTRHAALRTVLSGAVRDGLLATNPAAGVRLPRPVIRSRVAVLPTNTQLSTLQAAHAPLGLAVDLAALAGLRLGEIRGLQVRDLDLAAGALTVRRQVRDRDGGGWEVSPPKYGSVRTVSVPPELVRRLRLQLQDSGRLFTPQAWVVPGAGDSPVHPGTLARAWNRAKAAAGADPGLRLHDLRHLYASRLIADGVDILSVQHRLGHARASTTLDVYAHLMSGAPAPRTATAEHANAG